MDFAYIVCVLASSLFLQASFGQDLVTPTSPTASFQIKISPAAQVQQHSEGQNRVMTCESTPTDASEKPILHWEFNDIKITSTSKSDRVRVENIDADKLRLRIDSITNSDAGNYRCVGTLGTETDSRHVSIQIFENINIKSPERQFGIYGKHGVLKCNATGLPPPSFTWQYANGTNIRDNDRIEVLPNQLTIKNLTFEDNGDYLCDITTVQTGESQILNITFEVVKLPVIEREPVVKPDMARVTDTVTISCEADGVPQPTYQFKKGDTLMPASQVDSEEGILTITDLKLADEDDYVCVASNKGGSVEMSVFLDVKIQPTIRDMPDVTEAKEDEAKQVTCVSDGDPAPTVTWKKDGEEIDEDASSDDRPKETGTTAGDGTGNKTISKTLNFDPVTPSHGGRYTCTAKSLVGEVSKSFTLNVQYPPKFNTHYEESVFYGWQGHTTNMTCLVSANEVATITWYKVSNSESGRSEEKIIGDHPYTLSTLQTWPEHHLSSSSLLVQDTDRDKNVYGDYECLADNSQGTKRREVQLVKAVSPGVAGIRITQVLPTMVTLEIDAPENNGGQPVMSYNYSFFPVNDTAEQDDSPEGVKTQEVKVNADTTTTSVTLRNLLAKTTYAVKVQARNVVGFGEATTKRFETTDVSKPQQLNMTSAREGSEPTSYKVSWSEPYNGGSAITQYIIKYKKVTVLNTKVPQWQAESDVDKAFEQIIVTEPNARNYTIANLDRNSFYDIRITAKNMEGESMEEARIIKTSEAGGIHSSQAVEEGEGRGEEENSDDNDENSVNVGVVDKEKEEEDDDDEKTGDTLGQKSQTDSPAAAGLRSGAVIGIIVGILLIIVIIVVVLFLVFKRKPELVGRLRGLGGKGGEEERGKGDDGKDPAEEEKLIKKEDAVKVENETDEGKPEQAVEEAQEEFEPDSKPEAQPTPDAGAPQGDKSPELSTPAATTEIKITPETPEKPENPPA